MTVTTNREIADGDPADVAWLVRQAASGDRQAWERLVDDLVGYEGIQARRERRRRCGTDHVDAANRAHRPAPAPERVGSWLVARARNECLRNLTAWKRIVLVHEDKTFDDSVRHEPAIDEALLARERAEVVREAMAHLPRRRQRLMGLLMANPLASYAVISDELALPIGSIGPTRGRCLARLRHLIEAS